MPLSVWVGFPPERISFTRGKPAIHSSSEGVLRGYCQDCGTTLTYGRDPEFDTDSPLLYVSACSLDNPESFPPTEVIWYEQRPSWFELSGNVPVHDTISPVHSDRAYNKAVERQ